MSRDLERNVQWAVALLFQILFSSLLTAQVAKCGRFSLQDTQMPSYPPIARAAHMEATYHFRVLVQKVGSPEISLVDGPTQGMWQTLETNARNYIAARKYQSFESPAPCTYIATVQYRFVKGQLEPPNNFIRVTVIDEAHTLVEVEGTTQTVTY